MQRRESNCERQSQARAMAQGSNRVIPSDISPEHHNQQLPPTHYE